MRSLLALAVALGACGPAPDEESDGGAMHSGTLDGGDPADAVTGGGPDDAGGGLSVIGPYIVVADETEGIAINGDGADIDAVEFVCGGAEGFALRGMGRLHDGADPASAIGAPQGCDDPSACATSLGIGGWLVVELDGAVDLRGCTVRVYEVSDRSDEVFRVHACPGFAFEGNCRSLGSAEDGETLEVVVE